MEGALVSLAIGDCMPAARNDDSRQWSEERPGGHARGSERIADKLLGKESRTFSGSWRSATVDRCGIRWLPRHTTEQGFRAVADRGQGVLEKASDKRTQTVGLRTEDLEREGLRVACGA
jgi:hypothetical protein